MSAESKPASRRECEGVMTLRSIVVACLALLLGLGGGLYVGRFCGAGADVVVQFSPTPDNGANLRVYVSGAVVHPGVYPLHNGDRVADAVDAAGGPAADADTEAVNFALRIQDQEQIHIPRVGELVAPAAGTAAAAASAAPAVDLAATSAPTGSPQRVDVNHADVKLLRTLPGVGQTRAANIVDSRSRDGPFAQPQDLVQRKLLTQKIFDQNKDRIEALP